MTIYTTDALQNNCYQPPTGISKFSAAYDDVLDVFRVRIKGLVQFQCPGGKLAWDAGRRGTFLRAFCDGIDEVWNGKFAFVNNQGQRVVPDIAFESVANNAHLTVSVQSGVFPPEMAQHITSRSHMNLFAAGLDVANGDLVLRLDEGTVLPYQELIAPVTAQTLKDHASQLEAYDTPYQLATQSLKKNSGKIEFSNNSATISAKISQAISTAMAYTQTTILAGNKRVPLVVTGYRNSSENRNISQDRATNVAALVRQQGHLDPQLVSTQDGGSSFFGNRFATIAPLSLPQVIAKVDYRAAIHEFGHCLGLPDEYRLYPGMSIESSHDDWVTLCNQFGVTPRPYPAKHDSIMSCGSRVFQCHYVTLLDCLRAITGDNSWGFE